MTRMQRMQTVQRTAQDAERQRAQKLALCERRLAEYEAKLQELQTYHESYARQLATRGAQGIGGTGLRDYQTFLTRLAEAVRHQSQLVAQARAERDAERAHWQGAAQRAQALTRVVRSWEKKERQQLDRREQIESDERSQTMTFRRLDYHGA